MSAGARASADAPSPKRVAALVLAAGRSSRLGTPKQLLEIEGKPLLRRTVETALASQVARVVVAVEMGAVAIADSLRGLEWQRADVSDPQLGQSESIRAGLGVLERHELDAVVITPCDLPLLSSAHLNALIARYSEGDCLIVASRYQGTAGAPMLIDRALWPELHGLNGDTGARKILPRYEEITASVDWDAGQFDLDTPEDVRSFTQVGRAEARSLPPALSP